MQVDRQDDVSRGMQLLQQASEVTEKQADQQVGRVYADIHATLRVPFVNFIFRTLANYPLYLDVAWSHFSPFMRTEPLEQAADDLRTRALLEEVPDTSDLDWGQLGDIDRIRAFTDSISYVLPKLLLVATAFDEGLSRDTMEGPRRPTISSSHIPLGPAAGTIKVPLLNPKDADGQLHDLFQDLKQTHGHPGVASYYRALGHWPEFLQAVWNRTKPLVGTDEYEQRKRELIEQADRILDGIPLPSRKAAEAMGVSDQQIVDIRSILAVFRFKLIPDLNIDVTLIKAMLDGPDAARSSRFSASQRATSPPWVRLSM